MALRPLILTARRGNWRRFNARKNNPAFLKKRKEALLRDSNTCQYCGFTAEEYQDIVNIDHNYFNNKLENLATACCFCSQCFFLDSLTLDGNSGGTVIYLPEVSQADLNHFCRILFCALDKETNYKSRLQSAYMSLKDRVKPIELCFGPNTGDPQLFGQALIDSYLTPQEMNHALMRNVRLLPTRAAFYRQIEHWKKTVFAKVPL